MRFAFAVSTLGLVLAGCSSAEEAPAAQGSETALQSGDRRASTDDAEAPEISATGRPGDMIADHSAAESGDGYSSAYTSFDLDACTILTEEREEGSSATYRCPGYKGIALYVQEGDLRFDVDAGAENDRFETTGPFNSIADTAEWRIKDGRPFAIIFRYSVHSETGPKQTELAVEKIADNGTPGCRVAHIAGNTANANRRAREIADSMVSQFRCGAQKPINIGGTIALLGG